MKSDRPPNTEDDLFDVPETSIGHPAPPPLEFIGDWVILAAIVTLLGYVDYLTGFEFAFFAFYFIPIIIGTWRLGLLSGILLSIVSAVAWSIADRCSGHLYSNQWYAVWNTLMRLGSFLTVTWLTAHYILLRTRYRALDDQRRQLAATVKLLEGLLPICTSCKKICDHNGTWQTLERYIATQPEAKFSHGMCPECRKLWSAAAGLSDQAR
ncbi:MAG TPA: hypothetical protein VMB80_16660 [Candidatus Acidoferrum sp.]|nr:hypothetical protein [Candidatus Acidoferrum sp.]